jgi:hypothetical protein
MEANSKSKDFIWDEAPMLEKYCFETVDRTFRDLMKNIDLRLANIPFGGELIRQRLPVVRHGNRSAEVSSSFNRSNLWKYMEIYNLTINKRLETIFRNKYKRKTKMKETRKLPKMVTNLFLELPDDICMDFTKPLDFINCLYEDLLYNCTDVIIYLIEQY